ncbi:hypothetical protein E4T56_gene2856 [Termitomyces sp. T112]|nr:hypothetical protein E4T56_gene2856 [Termitomyces sp. T112]
MSDLASQFEKIIMACTFLDWVDCLLAVAHASLAKDPCLAVTTIFQTWLQWFKTVGSGVEWLELVDIEKECCQLYEQYKGKEWVHPFDVHFALVNPSLEFLMDDLTAGMMLFEDLLPNDQFFFQHSVVAEVECEASDMEVKGKEEFEAAPVTIKEERDKVAKGTKVQQRGTWSNTLLCQIGNNELEWLGEDLAWLMLLTPVTSLADFDERAAGVE